ncbi:hypothetical protein ACFL5F_01850 [Planctomycetota bacterium]
MNRLKAMAIQSVLPTGPPTTNNTFIIRATGIAKPNIFVEIDQQVIVQVQLDA